MAFAAALSEHPVTALAVGEVVGQILETLASPPDLALLFVTPPHGGALEDAAAAVRATLGPRTLLGCAGESIVGPGREVEGGPGVVLWAAHLGDAVPLYLRTEHVPDGVVLTGWPEDAPEDPSALLLLADPFSFPVDGFLERLDEDRPGLPVIGGMASAARGPGGNRLIVDDRVATEGAVGAFLPAGVDLATVVSQGCRPIGTPLVVTKAERNIVYELAGKPALERLQEVVNAATADERRLLAKGLHLGHVIDEHKPDFGRGDFLVRNVLGADKQTGAIAVGDVIDLGATVQFHVRDAGTADEDLRDLLVGHRADAALVFTCNGRGTRLFDVADHDATLVDEILDRPAAAGFFAAGELGPVGGRNFLHGFTASLALFGPG